MLLGPAQPSVQAGLPAAWAGAGGYARSLEPPALALAGRQGTEAAQPLTSQICVQPWGHRDTQDWKMPRPLPPGACCETQAETNHPGYVWGLERGPGLTLFPS